MARLSGVGRLLQILLLDAVGLMLYPRHSIKFYAWFMESLQFYYKGYGQWKCDRLQPNS
ncbi:hypothetical protein H6G20_23185 [Desertifilum sp. FACHB-1129]|uniref:Uncharacterized protein n=1 Tax=Desertifilum tharense IPPAS B-1220 TaxID=1781255 RepID=A0ACD5GXD7_9CYAN|nr:MULTISPECIES: hypothetical protein [Desertifilum]MBD2314577.1 hypothetical protein [Desertifilum sp. FACHB-1129]MBD2321746.1 hypothetical protein [Desertifilum sp. FACHB-866]MBD2331873.1 hypothetical protein [Desertifilum sp. FACHB-868]MDA0212602.1 hypothetical protein [Cyanobacteria bacterium FC1]